MVNRPLAYFITFTTYGTWLHGDKRGSVIVRNGMSEKLDECLCLYDYQQRELKHPKVLLSQRHRQIVLDTILKHCSMRRWRLFAAHVRTNHVHVLVSTATADIQKVARELKAWATRKLREDGCEWSRIWTDGGSTRYIYSIEKLNEKVKYVVFEQGDMMEHYLAEEYACWKSL